MTEYKDNEAYERDKANVIDALEQIMTDDYDEITINFADLADLLRQSKWVGADSDPSETFEEFVERISKEPPKFISTKPCTLLKDVETTMTSN